MLVFKTAVSQFHRQKAHDSSSLTELHAQRLTQ